MPVDSAVFLGEMRILHLEYLLSYECFLCRIYSRNASISSHCSLNMVGDRSASRGTCGMALDLHLFMHLRIRLSDWVEQRLALRLIHARWVDVPPVGYPLLRLPPA